LRAALDGQTPRGEYVLVIEGAAANGE
jgi:hypothetical protein